MFVLSADEWIITPVYIQFHCAPEDEDAADCRGL